MSLLKKKGIEFGMVIVVTLILIGVGIIVFYPWTDAIAGIFTRGGKEVACTASLFQGKGTAKCPINKVSIFPNEVELDGKTFLKKGEKGIDDTAKEALAKLLKNCLNRGGGYNSRAFGNENYFETESVCLQCSTIKIDESAGTITDLNEYLRDTKVKGINSDKTYLQDLTRDEQHLEVYMKFGLFNNLIPGKAISNLQPRQEYTIFFIGFKQGYIKKFISDFKNLISFDLFAYFGSEGNYFAYIVESDRLNKVCNRIVN